MYTFDPHNALTANDFSLRLQHSDINNKYKLYIFDYPVYHNTLRLRNGSKSLAEGVDYYVGHTYLRGTMVTAKRLVGSVWSIEPVNQANLLVSGRYLGGDYGVTDARKQQYLASMENGPDVDKWDTIIGDVFFPPVDIKFDIEAWFGESELMQSMDRVANAIKTKPVADSPFYDMAKRKLDYIVSVINDSEWFNHQADRANPHGLHAHEVNALHRTGTVGNTTKAYGKDINQLLTYIKQNAPGIATLASNIHRSDELRTNAAITLNDELSQITAPAGTIDLSTGNGLFVTPGSVRVVADVDKSGNAELRFTCGENVLKIVSTGNDKSPDELYINGDRILTIDNINSHLPDVDFDEFIVKYINSEGIIFRGDGTKASPLSGDYNAPYATNAKQGIVKLTNDAAVSRFDIVATPELVNRLHGEAENCVTRTSRINNVPIIDGINIDKNTLGIPLADNVSDANKPLSHASVESLSHKSDKNHTHTLDAFGFTEATSTTYGIAKAVVNNPAVTGKAVSPYAANAVNDTLIKTAVTIDNYVPQPNMPVRLAILEELKIRLNLGEVEYGGDSKVYLGKKWYDLEPAIIVTRNLPGTIKYAYAHLVGERVTIELSGAQPDINDLTRLELFRVVANPDGTIVSHNIRDTVQALGFFDTMVDHIEDRFAHRIHGDTLEGLGLQNISNLSLVTTTSQLTDAYISVARADMYLSNRTGAGISVRHITYTEAYMCVDGKVMLPWKFKVAPKVIISPREMSINCTQYYFVDGFSNNIVWIDMVTDKDVYKSGSYDDGIIIDVYVFCATDEIL